jgi:hypothetical protein
MPSVILREVDVRALRLSAPQPRLRHTYLRTGWSMTGRPEYIQRAILVMQEFKRGESGLPGFSGLPSHRAGIRFPPTNSEVAEVASAATRLYWKLDSGGGKTARSPPIERWKAIYRCFARVYLLVRWRSAPD